MLEGVRQANNGSMVLHTLPTKLTTCEPTRAVNYL